METSKSTPRVALNHCGGVTLFFLITSLTVLIILFLTLLKPKEPKITTQTVMLENMNQLFFPSVQLNMTLGTMVTVNNPNYGNFEYQDSKAYFSYRGHVVAEAPIVDGAIPARGKHNISTSVTVYSDKLASNSNFNGDYYSGFLSLSSTTSFHGKVSMLKYFKVKATSYRSCDISIYVQPKRIDSVCKSRVNSY